MPNITCEKSSLLAQIEGISHGFFARSGGVSQGHFGGLNCSYLVGDDPALVEKNRASALDELKLKGVSLVSPQLVHGKDLLVIRSPTQESAEADAIITEEAGLAIGITYADCLPILMASSDGAVIAAIHAGWRGIVAGVIESAVRHLRPLLKGDAHLLASIGPLISPENFVVQSEVAEIFLASWPEMVYQSPQGFHVDLYRIALAQLIALEINNVDKTGGYTDLDPIRYFSHRTEKPHTGRHIAIISRT